MLDQAGSFELDGIRSKAPGNMGKPPQTDIQRSPHGKSYPWEKLGAEGNIDQPLNPNWACLKTVEPTHFGFPASAPHSKAKSNSFCAMVLSLKKDVSQVGVSVFLERSTESSPGFESNLAVQKWNPGSTGNVRKSNGSSKAHGGLLVLVPSTCKPTKKGDTPKQSV